VDAEVRKVVAEAADFATSAELPPAEELWRDVYVSARDG